jgi:hypothetical protein
MSGSPDAAPLLGRADVVIERGGESLLLAQADIRASPLLLCGS